MKVLSEVSLKSFMAINAAFISAVNDIKLVKRVEEIEAKYYELKNSVPFFDLVDPNQPDQSVCIYNYLY